MTNASVRAAAQEIAKRGALTPHQLSAFSQLDELLTDSQRQAFTELWRAEGSPAADADPTWMAPALKVIREHEGLATTSYRDPVGLWTIGYGLTRLNGGPVREGDTITKAQAEQLLRRELLDLFAPGLFTLLPMAKKWKPNQQAALLSFAFNTGLGALEDSTLRKRLLAGEDPVLVVNGELPRWKHAGEAVLAGLERRRAAEVALFMGGASANSVLLKVPYFSQLDNKSGEGARECASSSCAMVAAFFGKITGGDDEYNKLRAKWGDTTDIQAHVKTLRALGLDARFRTDATPVMLETELRAGRPIAVGWLHKGSASAASGGGHWSVAIGYSSSHWIHNDPYGEADMVKGGYINHSGGKGVAYSRKNWNRRWMPDGKGWAIFCQPLA